MKTRKQKLLKFLLLPQKFSQRPVFVKKVQSKTQWEAGDHRTDCLWHIVSVSSSARHIVFTLAYCQQHGPCHGEEVARRGEVEAGTKVG